ncbi:hypothetical protein HAX54_050835, partial [Datura stramonium]|nr:hypothetical protein [Datura stramonium]
PILRINLAQRFEEEATTLAVIPSPPLPPQRQIDDDSMQNEGIIDHLMDMDDPPSDDK